MKKKIIIFGAGAWGRRCWNKMHKTHEIVCFADNNPQLSGKTVFDLPIINGNDLLDVYAADIDVVICIDKYHSDIGCQLINMGICEYYVFIDGLLYRSTSREQMLPFELNEKRYYRKSDSDEKNILFLQAAACIRTLKIAATMKNEGYKVFLLYTKTPPDSDSNSDLSNVFDETFTFYTIHGMVDFITNSDFDIVHSSNYPDMYTALLPVTNKPFVFDIHDLRSIGYNMTLEDAYFEYLSLEQAHGIINVSEGCERIVEQRCNLDGKETFVLPNYILKQNFAEKILPKLSQQDGMIHLVYEGGIFGTKVGEKSGHYRWFEDIWRKITDCKIHIHYYSQADIKYCRELAATSPYLHYEGNLGSSELAVELTKYDAGLACLNMTKQNAFLLNIASPNKPNEYLNAMLPVIFNLTDSRKNFLSKYDVGICLDFDGDIKAQITEACRKKVDRDFLTRNKMTMFAQGAELTKFYERVIKKTEGCM